MTIFDKFKTRSAAAGRNESLTVLITNIILCGRSGTETLTRDLALGLLGKGHRPIVYTQALGEIADELRRASVPVVTRIDKIGVPIDVIHGHHTPVAAVAMARFPQTPAIFIAHDFLAWHDAPPRYPTIRRYIAVDTTVAGRLTAELGFSPSDVHLLLNSVDTGRFLIGPPLPDKPRRALVYAKNLEHVEAVKEACARRGIEVDIIGSAVGKIVSSPETILHSYDLVFGSALSALEAMASGRAVVVCDGRGLAGMAAVDRLEAWRPQNFGLRCLRHPVTVETLLTEIDAYDPRGAADVCQAIRADANKDIWLDQVEAIYRDVIREHKAASPQDAALATALYLEEWTPRFDQTRTAIIDSEEAVEFVSQATFTFGRSALGVRMATAMDAISPHIRLLQGFGPSEHWGAWTISNSALALVRLPSAGDESNLQLFAEVIPFLTPTMPVLDVDVLLNGRRITTWTFDSRDPGTMVPRLLDCPASLFKGMAAVWLLLEIRNPRKPREAGMSQDGRLLGLGLVALTWRLAQEKCSGNSDSPISGFAA
jgi:hypothetical protein